MKIVILHLFIASVLFLAQYNGRELVSRGYGALKPRRVRRNRRH